MWCQFSFQRCVKHRNRSKDREEKKRYLSRTTLPLDVLTLGGSFDEEEEEEEDDDDDDDDDDDEEQERGDGGGRGSEGLLISRENR